MARIADVTGKPERSKHLSLTGLAFGLGFTLGPALGGGFILAGNMFGAAPPFGAHFASIGAALLSALNFLQVFLFFKESHHRKPLFDSLLARPKPALILRTLRLPALGQILGMSCLLWLALAQIEPTLILLVQDDFYWEKTKAYWGFAYIGFLMAFSQGFFGPQSDTAFWRAESLPWGLKAVAAGLLGMAGAALLKEAYPSGDRMAISLLAIAVTLFSVGYSFASAGLNGAISLLSKPEDQGKTFGVHKA